MLSIIKNILKIYSILELLVFYVLKNKTIYYNYKYNFSDVTSRIEFIYLYKKLELESHHQLLLRLEKTQLSYCVETIH